MGKISFPLKYWAYLPTRSFSYSSGSFCGTFLGVFTRPGGFSGWIGLSDSEGSGKDGQFEPMGLVTCVSGSPRSSDCFGGGGFGLFSFMHW